MRAINGYTDGWTHPGTAYIGRPNRALKLAGSALGNPFKIGPDGNRAAVVAKYRAWLAGRVAEARAGRPNAQYAELQRLAGLVVRAGEGEELRLACYCKPQACHGDVVREWVVRMVAEAAGGGVSGDG